MKLHACGCGWALPVEIEFKGLFIGPERNPVRYRCPHCSAWVQPATRIEQVDNPVDPSTILSGSRFNPAN